MSRVVTIKYVNGTSMASSFNAPTMEAPYNGHLSMAITWTGTPTGTLALHGSSDGSNFAAIPGASTEFTTQPAGAAQSTPLLCNWTNVPCRYWRLVYTASGSTGALTVYASMGDTAGGH